MQELLRHASSRVTLDTYTQAVTIHKRRAQSRVVRLFRGPAVALPVFWLNCALLCLEERLRMPENTSDCANRARQLAMKLCLFVPAAKTVIVRNPFILLTSPTGFEPVLPP